MLSPKRNGGLGIGDIRSLNLSLLAKWWWKLKTNDKALWGKVIKAIHSNKNSDSSFPVNNRIGGIWKDIISVEKELAPLNLSLRDNLMGVIQSGQGLKFWLDRWHDEGLVKDCFSELFQIVKEKKASVVDIVEMGRTNRWQDLWVKEALDSSELQQLELLKKLVRDIRIKVGPDKWTWRGTTEQDLTVANLRYKIHEAWKTDNAEAWAFGIAGFH
ncbi:hypothetical protein HanRHA438_Chr01g0012631 [Helianthus annuus]|nr:hypothetical protein HanRHA438_Chr01g0012631 [Helianthus annuus]